MAKVLIHIGKGEARKTYTFDTEAFPNQGAISIEQDFGLRWPELIDALIGLSMVAVTAVVWILRRETEPGLQFTDIKFAIGDLETEPVVEPSAPKDSDSDESPPEQS